MGVEVIVWVRVGSGVLVALGVGVFVNVGITCFVYVTVIAGARVGFSELVGIQAERERKTKIIKIQKLLEEKKYSVFLMLDRDIIIL